MDRVALEILRQGLKQDGTVIAQAAALAKQRLEEANPGSAEACGYELHRLYNVLGKSFERVCEAFENHFEKRGDYHERLIERMTLDLPAIRPAFLPLAAREAVRELKAFRHLIRHAYDLQLRADRLAELASIAAAVSAQFPMWIEGFAARAAAGFDE